MSCKPVMLGDLCHLITKGTTPTTLGHNYTTEGIPFLRAQNISGGSIRFDGDDLFISQKTHQLLRRSQIKSGDVLLSIAGTIGRAGIVPDIFNELNCNQAVAIIRVKEGIDRSYLRHWLESRAAKRQIESLTVIGVISNLSLTQIGNLKIPLPPLPEQRRIAAILDKADSLRATRREALGKLDSLAQEMFLEMFGDPMVNPKKFPVVNMGDVCDVRDGTHDSPKYVTKGYPLVTSKNLVTGEIDLKSANLISQPDYDSINKRSKVHQGDLLMPMIGTIGNPVLVDHEPNYAVKNVAIIKFPNGAPSNRFVLGLLSGHYFDQIVSRKNRGGNQKFVSLGDLRAFPIPLPPPLLQQEFTRRMTVQAQIKPLQKKSLAEMEALLASLQHRAFQGELT